MKKLSFLSVILGVLIHNSAYCAEGFYNEIDLNKLPNISTRLQQAFKNTLPIGKGEKCTIIPVGKDIALTALHCLEGKISFNGLPSPDRSGLIYQVRPNDANNMIIATGGSFGKFFESMIEPDHWSNQYKKHYLNAQLSDWVLIRWPTGDSEPLCIQRPRKTDGDIFAIGFPMRAIRSEQPSNGSDKYISYGALKSDLKLNSYIMSLPEKSRDFNLNVIGTAISQKRLLHFDADIRPGNSGGPLLNEKGNVIGIVVAGFFPMPVLNEFEYAANAGIAISMEEIVRSLHAKKIDLKKYFQCIED